jgi:hypothetical protein
VNPRILLLSLALLTIVVILLVAPAIAHIGTPDSDYGLHAELIRRLVSGENSLETFLKRVPHFLFHLFVLLGYAVSPATPLLTISILIAVVFYVLGAWAVFWRLCNFAGRPRTYRAGLWYAVGALVAVLVAPANIFTPNNMYLGYMTSNLYHNPTTIVLKPFSLVLLVLAGRVFEPVFARIPRKHLLLYVAMVVLSLLAKPSYVLVLLPALVMVTAFQVWRRNHVNWLFLVVGILLPAGLLLGVQTVLLQSKVSNMDFAPLAVVQSWAKMFNPQASEAIPLKILMTVLFPLVVYLGYFKNAVRNVYLNLAWLTWGFGAALYFLFAEEGNRLSHGNLTWSGQIAMFVLFAASLAFFYRQNRAVATGQFKLNPVFLLSFTALILHLVSGIYWLLVHVTMMPTEIIYTIW